MQRVWNGDEVQTHAVKRAINQLRTDLGDPARELIQNQYGGGYRLTPAIEVERVPESPELLEGIRKPGMDYPEFNKRTSSQAEVRIFGTFLYALTEMPEHRRDHEPLLDALERAKSAEILLLHPNSRQAVVRNLERPSVNCLLHQVENLRFLSHRFPSTDGGRSRVRVRLYSVRPPLNLFQAGSWCSIGWYEEGRPLIESPRVECDESTAMGEIAVQFFRGIWGDAQPLEEAFPKGSELASAIEHPSGRTSRMLCRDWALEHARYAVKETKERLTPPP